MNKLEYVRQFVEMGISVMPLYHRSKIPILSTWCELQSKLPSEQEMNSWFATDWCNYAVIAGWQNLVVIDFDTFELFDLWRLVMRFLNLRHVVETSFKVVTAHGLHVYLRTMERTENSKRIAKSGGIDVQAQGRYVVGPGCVHPSGTQYVPVGELQLLEVESIEQVLPLEYFPSVRTDDVIYHGAPVEFVSNHTEYQDIDPFSLASCDSVDLITKVKASVRIESLFPGAVRSSTDGRWLKAICLFHDDHHESFWIDTRRQLCGCQVCGFKPLDVVNLYSKMHGINNHDAVIALACELSIL